MTPEQRDIILDEIIINNPKIRQDLLQACAGAQLDLNKLKEILPSTAFVSKVPQGATGPRKAIVHRFWKPHTKYTLSTSTCRDILTWLSKFGDLLTSNIDEFVDVVLKETRCPTNFNGALDLIDNHILAVLYTADIIKPSKLTLHRHFDVNQNPIVDNPRISVANALVYKKSRKEQNNNDYDLFEENDMNIYEQLNKINDTESLSEKYNVKNVKELKKLQESVTDRAIAWYVDSGTAEDEAHEYSAENPDDWNAGNPEFVARALDWYENSYYAELDSQDHSIFRKPEKFQHDGVNYAKKLHLSDSTNEYAVYNIQQYDNWKNSINYAYNKLKNMFPDMIKWERGYGKEGYKYFVITTDSVYQIDNSFNVVKRLTESSNGKQDVRHEAQRIHDELIKKGYTDEEIDSIIRILHTSAINNFEPARPKLKAAFPDLDI